MANLMEIVAELPDEGFLPVWPRQEPSVLMQCFQGAKESQPLNDFADE